MGNLLFKMYLLRLLPIMHITLAHLALLLRESKAAGHPFEKRMARHFASIGRLNVSISYNLAHP